MRGKSWRGNLKCTAQALGNFGIRATRLADRYSYSQARWGFVRRLSAGYARASCHLSGAVSRLKVFNALQTAEPWIQSPTSHYAPRLAGQRLAAAGLVSHGVSEILRAPTEPRSGCVAARCGSPRSARSGAPNAPPRRSTNWPGAATTGHVTVSLRGVTTPPAMTPPPTR